jgi:hypothetical protein
MYNNFDLDAQEDFNSMTEELGREVLVYPRVNDLNYEGQEDTASGLGTAVTEIVFLQELDSSHEVVASGQLNIGDIKLLFKSNTIAQEEGYVFSDNLWYKILSLSIIKGQSNNSILYVKAFGKKVPGR